MNPVRVGVNPHEVAKRRWQGDELHFEASIDRVVGFAGAQRDHCRLAQSTRVAVCVAILVRAVVRNVLCRLHITTRCHKLHDIIARNQTREAVSTATGGHCRLPRDLNHVRIQQVHCHAVQARFAAVLNPVPVGVNPHEVAQRCWLVDARVERCIEFAGQKLHDLCLTVGWIRIAIDRVEPVRIRILGREHVARWQVTECHLVLNSRYQLTELIAAVSSSSLSDSLVADSVDPAIFAAVGQSHGNAGDSQFTDVLEPIRIRVFPHIITQPRVETHGTFRLACEVLCETAVER